MRFLLLGISCRILIVLSMVSRVFLEMFDEILNDLELSNVKVVPDEYSGHTLYASNPCSFHIPYSKCITAKQIKREELTEKESFIVYLLTTSTPYVKSLPTRFKTPIFNKLGILANETRAKQSSLEKLYAKISHLIPDRSLQDVYKADAQFNSRIIESPIGLILVPGIDLCNHSFTPNASISYTSDAVECEITQPGLVTLNYGEKSNTELLFSYGFIVVDNPFNSVHVDAPLVFNQEDKLEILKSQGIQPRIKLSLDFLDIDSFYILVLGVSELEFEKDAFVSLRHTLDFPLLEARAYTILLQVIDFHLEEHRVVECDGDLEKEFKKGQLSVLEHCRACAVEKQNELMKAKIVQEYLQSNG